MNLKKVGIAVTSLAAYCLRMAYFIRTNSKSVEEYETQTPNCTSSIEKTACSYRKSNTRRRG